MFNDGKYFRMSSREVAELVYSVIPLEERSHINTIVRMMRPAPEKTGACRKYLIKCLEGNSSMNYHTWNGLKEDIEKHNKQIVEGEM